MVEDGEVLELVNEQIQEIIVLAVALDIVSQYFA